ncbi:ABC transporter permease [Microbacterium azadirachtae]|uniref:Putative D,D-dipeptide transport system permease protein DdpC n=1 Tax=Microbacterium azadirachtae TaxID=582680 RepID=A0A0F0LFD9_9MICO|nr:ABC transporter permease [Microbacterium azadirachtae]KJL31404.1 putative D,D-dipeptide transport system permease protein DdpC [Microbacterium azadirachtae]
MLETRIRPRRTATGALSLLLRNPSAMVGLVIILFWTLGGLVALFASPYDPNQTGVGPLLSPPSGEHLFGTDNFGRDIFSRVLAGARVSLWTGLIAVAVSLVVGLPIGAIAGYVRGTTGMVLMRIMDMLLAFPSLLLAMALAVALGPGLGSAMIAVGVVGIPEFARIMYGQTVALREREFVEASRAIGLGDGVILFRHILPNGMAPIMVRSALGMGYAILTAAALSFIGLGAQPPLAEWGVMISDGRGYIISGEWWMTFFPGLAIATSILAFNLLGDGLRDTLDPRLRTSAR